MSHIYSKKSSVKLPPPNRVEKNEEWARELGDLLVCPRCGNIHYEKKWHRSEDPIPAHFKDVPRAEKVCLACAMIQSHTFEGEVIIENVPAYSQQDLLNLINAFGKKAMERDPQDRIISIEQNDGVYRITTTENQLAVRLGKKIKDAFRSVDLNISHAAEPSEVSRVHVRFKDIS